MADRYPLIANPSTNKIEELAANDNLNLTNSGIVGASTITAQQFVGNLSGTATTANNLSNAANITTGTINPSRLAGTYNISITGTATTANNLSDAANITTGTISTQRLSGNYPINITGTATTANNLSDAANISDGYIARPRLTGVYDISITGDANLSIGSSIVVFDTQENKTNYIVSVASTTVGIDSGIVRANIDKTGLVYNPGLNRLGIGSTSPTESADIIGNVKITGNYLGNGDAISGIVTTIVAGIGITLSPTNGKGQVTVSSFSPVGKTIFVNQNGFDGNSGLTENNAKRTIKAAAAIAFSGDTIKVSPGVYNEDNPIILNKNVSLEGLELRNCIVTPNYTSNDLFHVNNGVHITNFSFIGPESTDGAAIIAFQPLYGVSSGRYFDASRLIRLNSDFIAREAVGYLTSTDYRSPAFSLADPAKCASDIKSILKAVSYDITRGGNSKCVGAGKTYYTDLGALQHIVGVKTETIDAFRYAAGIAVSCINNVTWTGNYQDQFYQVKDLAIQTDPDTDSNTDINSCANVVSAIYSCVGVVTTIIKQGLSVLGVGINTTYPGNNGSGSSIPDDPSFSPGVGPITQGPYIRNCTNFIPKSIGMKINGFDAEPGDQDDIGVTGSMSVDSYTQYNQGGIGCSITNGAYAQLVSFFTICDDIAVYTGSGGQCDITNSNSSFGNYGLVSEGIGDNETGSIYRYTGTVQSTAIVDQDTIVVSGIGSYRPYSGQSLYFDKIYYTIKSIEITNNGSGYTTPPIVTIDDPTGPNGIKPEALANIQDGKVTSVTLINTGTQYETVPNITFSSGSASAIVKITPIYYKVDRATLPSAGISTIVLAKKLNNTVGVGSTVFFARSSFQLASSHSFEYIGSGVDINRAKPALGGITIPENQTVKINGGDLVYTSTDQSGNFKIGDDVVINQNTGTITGAVFTQSLLNTVTPLIVALSK